MKQQIYLRLKKIAKEFSKYWKAVKLTVTKFSDYFPLIGGKKTQ